MNLPNAISTFRLCLVPVFALVYFSGIPNSNLYAFAIFFVAGVSDLLDGYIARKYNMITNLGRILDPLADKLMVFTALLSTAIAGKIQIIFAALYFLKESVQVYLSFVLAKKLSNYVPPANFWGKGATFLFYAAIAFATLMPHRTSLSFCILCLGFVFSIIAFVSYYFRAKELVYKDK